LLLSVCLFGQACVCFFESLKIEMKYWLVCIQLIFSLTLVKSNIETELLYQYNVELLEFNHFGAEIAWNLSTHLDNAKELLGNSII